MQPEGILVQALKLSVKELYGVEPDDILIQVQKTNRDFEGDFTIVVFPILRISNKKPEDTANEIGNYIKNNYPEVESFNVVKGFLNISLSHRFWCETINSISQADDFGFAPPHSSGKTVMVEFSSPNTNKPLHLGHIRNNILGFAVARVLEANGHKVFKVNLVNDRGIHICKSMLAWQKFAHGETPSSSGIKGDFLVGKYYVAFEQVYKKQVAELAAQGMSEEEARLKAPLIVEAQEMLRRWEAKDPEIYTLWERMNGWVYSGFDTTYKSLGIEFDKVYYESQTYLLGKTIVQEGLDKGVFYKRPDGSVWIDLTNNGLDEKLLLRSDGTSVYITQDIGTAIQRFTEYHLNDHIYVVGNEQEYHFQVLRLILAKLGYDWSEHLYHLSYGMVNLPEGKMKSREGIVVDADDLVEEMHTTARDMSKELGKLDDVEPHEAEKVVNMVGLGALKYFILKVDPKKNMTFNPKESIDFNGNTGPFIQYTHARIQSVMRKAADMKIAIPKTVGIDKMGEKEKELIKIVSLFPKTVNEAARELNPALVANYVYELAKEYNQFYHEFQILREENGTIRELRLVISREVANVIRRAFWLLGIDVPQRM
ncbi:MAG TPA: arginine--tRNA ligase [Tenuifilaceae bacterium]|jgi:arginyl-tRNA synthetase|nr:arginine--tRNA ligase [Bacteroidales bacterium]MDI9517047.1 arginine--tRNA ligase [Bacteroidota bacterium]NLH55360.1 arginine--tRNA ligase [Rikenellaceae bacterium]OQC62707.1 MAG: Arginine--tRNA ligase [Bacteroidetes bacterium ADurb.Bin008]HNV82183.1 arginine--tRNA ligase [Tenuifilaceae bacterium]